MFPERFRLPDWLTVMGLYLRYKFHMIDLIGTGNDTFANRVDRTIPLVLDWAIRDGGICRKLPSKDDGVSAESTASACVSPNSYCVNATHGPGYLCNCSNGYRGNPYITGRGECTSKFKYLFPIINSGLDAHLSYFKMSSCIHNHSYIVCRVTSLNIENQYQLTTVKTSTTHYHKTKYS